MVRWLFWRYDGIAVAAITVNGSIDERVVLRQDVAGGADEVAVAVTVDVDRGPVKVHGEEDAGAFLFSFFE